MSDLACACTVIFARHAEAEYVETWFSEEGGTLSALGRRQAHELGASLSSERITRVWCSDTSRAVQTAELAADALGLEGDLAVVTRKSLREMFIGDLIGEPFEVSRLREVTDKWAGGDLGVAFPGGESGAEVISRYRGALDEIADQHRGETVLVIGHESAACTALPGIGSNLSPPYDDTLRHLANGETVQLRGDADGWVLDRWGSAPPIGQ